MSGRVEVTVVQKPWGHETIWAHTDRYVGKVLHIKAGEALSVQYHHQKDETIHLLRGNMIYRVGVVGGDLHDIGLKEGESYRNEPGTVHQMEAVTDCDVLEASTPFLDDVVRLSDRYGRTGDERAVKVIIPLAGKGTRLRPLTHTVPKPMLRVAGKPVMDYVLDDVRKLADVEEVIYITGHLKEAVEWHVRSTYGNMKSTFIEQRVQDGTAGAVALAKSRVNGPVLIIFADTIFDADLSVIASNADDGILWTKEVEDWQRFGVVTTDASGHMTRIVEKPKTAVSKRVNIGLQYIRNWKLLFEGIDHVMKAPQMKGEWYLTDAFQYMVDHGAKLKVLDVAGWYDAGKAETLLATNRVLLEKGRARKPAELADCTIIEPVYIEDGVQCPGSTIGPNVSISAGSSVLKSKVRDAIVGAHARIVESTLADSLVGDHAVVERFVGALMMGDHSEVRGG